MPEILSLLALSSTFLLILLAEMGDKTQIMTVSLAARYGSPAQVFLGAFLGEVGVSIIGIAVGTVIASMFFVDMVSRVAGVAFILFGLISLLKKERQDRVEAGGKYGSSGKILAVFSMIAAAEIGDKTQLAIIALSAQYNSPFSIALGVASGFALLSLVAVMLGTGLSRVLPMGLIRKLAAVTFIAVGVALVLGVF